MEAIQPKSLTSEIVGLFFVIPFLACPHRPEYCMRRREKKSGDVLAWIIHEICSKLILDINFKTVTMERVPCCANKRAQQLAAVAQNHSFIFRPFPSLILLHRMQRRLERPLLPAGNPVGQPGFKLRKTGLRQR